MSVGAAIRIGSPDEERVILHAAEFARQQRMPCYVISVVRELPYGAMGDEESDAVRRNLELIAESKSTPVIQVGGDIAKSLIAVARGFGVRTLFLMSV
jgi:K+-sensing histidine kinase KdpD